MTQKNMLLHGKLWRGEPVVWSKVSQTGIIESIYHALGIADTYPENWGALCGRGCPAPFGA